MEENKQENIEQVSPKEVYVVNLDHRRIFLLSGFFLLLVGVAFWLGASLNASSRYQAPQETAATQTFLLDEVEDGDALRKRAQEELAKLEAPPMSNAKNMAANSIPVKEDPLAAKTLRKSVTAKEKEQKIQNAAEGGFYTVQVAAYTHEKDALRVSRELKEKGISNARVDKGVMYYYVRAGKANRENSLVSLNQKIDKLLNSNSKIVFKKS